MRIAAFDIGKKNFAFYIEEFELSTLESLRKEYAALPKKFQRRVKGPMNEHIADIQNKMCKKGKTVVYCIRDLRHIKTSNELDQQTRLNLFKLLDEYVDHFQKCDTIIIEQQYFSVSKKGAQANIDAIRIGECCYSWFLVTFASFKHIQYFGSTFKTHTLGAPDDLTKSQRKKWSEQKAYEILEMRDEKSIIDSMKKCKNSLGRKQKMDDVGDCILMIQAYKYKTYISE